MIWFMCPQEYSKVLYPIGVCSVKMCEGLSAEASLNKDLSLGPGEMVQWLRAWAALPKDQGSIPSTHMAPVLGYLAPSHRHICRQNTNAHKTKTNKLLKKKKT